MTQPAHRPDPPGSRRQMLLRALGLVAAVACALWIADHLR